MENTKNKLLERATYNREESNGSEFNILLRFSASGKVYSLKVPNTWTVRKLEKFIESYFKEEVKSSIIIFLLGAKKLENPLDHLTDHLKSGYNELNQIIVSTKKNQGISENEAEKKFWFDNREFEQAEIMLLTSYNEIINKNEEKMPNNQNFLFKMPLMHNSLNQRMTSLNEKHKLDMMSTADYGNIENFSLRYYIKIELLFKLFFFFILFGIHMKGYNIPIFITLLVIYYWYFLYLDINAFYDKKIGEIKLTKEEIREVKNDFRFYEEEIKNEQDINQNNEKVVKEILKDDNTNQDTDNITDENKNKISEEMTNRRDFNICPKDNEDNRLSNENDINYDYNYGKENDIIVENEEIRNNRNNTSNNFENENIYDYSNSKSDSAKRAENLPEMEGISNLVKKYDNREKGNNSKDKHREGAIQFYSSFIFEIIFTLVMSLFPFWYDEFEAQNPVVVQQNNTQINISDTQAQTQTPNLLNEENANNHIDKRPFEENNFELQYANDVNKLNRNHTDEEPAIRDENHSLRPEIEMTSKRQKFPDYQKSHNSEKILIKSSNDTRLVNHSEDQNIVNNTVTKYILVDENENKTENEFVFSENVNIDTLSYNEPILESLKKKNEKEHEEMHFN